MEHLQNHLESDFEEGDVLVDFLAFDEPVGVFVPDSGIEGFDGFGEAVVCEIVLDFFFAGGEFAADPVFAHVVGRVGKFGASFDGAGIDDFGILFFGGDFDGDRAVRMGFVDEGLDETGDIPEFITEVAARNDGVFGEGLVHAGGTATENAETEGVGAIFRDKFDRVDDVALRFRHFLAMSVKH